jgi:hypothetical protein
MAINERAVVVEETAVAAGGRSRYFEWRPMLTGAAAAAALGIVLHGFAAAIGLSLGSTSPTWRDSSTALTLLAGVYLVFAAVISFGLGGYVAGRAVSPLGITAADREEAEFRDGLNGLAAWAFAVVLTALLVFGAAQSTASRLAAPGAQPSSTAENLAAFDLDRLFRSDKATPGDITYVRAEAGRILLTANGHNGLAAEDHDYLVRLVSRETGLSAADATKRVDETVARSSENVARARRTGVILAFMAAAAALIGAVMAWSAACAGGRHRDALSPSHLWNWRRPIARAARP